MNDIYITLTGNVAAEPRQYSFDDGTRVTSLRVFTSHRYFDKKTGQWTDGDRVCFTVRCWRALGENVATSMRAGQPVVVSGKLRIREFGPEGDRRFVPEIEASAVGHDLRWGTGTFAKPDRGSSGVGSMSREMRDRLDAETQDWAMGSRPLRGLPRSERTPEADLGRVLGAERDTVHSLRAHDDTARTLGMQSDPVRTVGPDAANGRPSPLAGETPQAFAANPDDAPAWAPPAPSSLTWDSPAAGVNGQPGPPSGMPRQAGPESGGEGGPASGMDAVGDPASEAKRDSGQAVRGKAGTGRTQRTKVSTSRPVGPESDTVRVLGANDQATFTVGADEDDRDTEQPAAGQRAAA
ncbi:single-stranded DNA-binding protein [Nonomuraea sp. K274]|uniref:Single-stranded DNA-binding protein n=1 Tax=Nonomuraea cypriaca TaxID=1187855 RepID=A0A931A4G1_9ACTN|nr:single-stranded DNA-binding protein [Nonomuraea cypriaca]MBF8186101.1 single-stranded DNA-binding protein [Nonomuraea cypriaca]